MTPGINTLLLSTGVLGSFTCSGMTLPIYMGPTALRGNRATGDTLSNVESQVFTPYKFGSTAGDRTPNLLTTRPTCYHSATALCRNGPRYLLHLHDHRQCSGKRQWCRFLIDHSIILLGCVIQHGFLKSGILFSLKLLGGYFKVISIRVVWIVACRDM